MRRLSHNVQATCALGAMVLAPPMVVHTPRSLWQITHRLRRYALYGMSLTGVGLAMLYVTVSHFSLNQFLAQMLVVPLVMHAVSYVVHRFRTFGDREVSHKRSGKRFAIVRFGGMGFSKISFYVLVGLFGLQYLLASILITVTLAWPTYKLNRDWAFRQTTQETDA